MVKVLIIRNCPVVILSYMIDAIKNETSVQNIQVFTHEHAANQIRELEDVDGIIPYRKKDLFHYKDIPKDQFEKLKTSEFDRICFFIEKGQKNGFENLLMLSKKIIPPHGKIIGLTSKGERVLFSKEKIRKTFFVFYLNKVAASFIFLLIVLCLPALLGIAFLKKQEDKPYAHNK